jgi:hypothetical protein
MGAAYGPIAIGVENTQEVCDRIRKARGKLTREPGPMKHGTTVLALVGDPGGAPMPPVQRQGQNKSQAPGGLQTFTHVVPKVQQLSLTQLAFPSEPQFLSLMHLGHSPPQSMSVSQDCRTPSEHPHCPCEAHRPLPVQLTVS